MLCERGKAEKAKVGLDFELGIVAFTHRQCSVLVDIMTLKEKTIWLNEEEGGEAVHTVAWFCVGRSPPVLFTALSILVLQAGSTTACLSRGAQLRRYFP